MPAFEFVALDAAGKRQRGMLEGDTARQVRQSLRESGLSPLSVEAVAEGAGGPRRGRRRTRLPADELALFTRQLATLLITGAPLAEALGTALRQARKPRVQRVLSGVRARVVEGRGMAAGMADFPAVFDDVFRATVAAGEQSGKLDAVLARLADYTESRQALQQRVQQALIYPSFLVIMAFGILAGLLGYVVPKIVQVFTTMHAQLPLLTRVLIGISGFLRGWWPLLLLALIALVLGVRALLRRPGPLQAWQRFLLRLPFFGRLVRGLETARFARTLSILTASGVPILEGLGIAQQVVHSLPMRAALAEATVRVREGSGIAAALERSGYFPPMAVYLIASGEGGGQLESMLERAAQQQEREAQGLISTSLALFEPMTIVFMGLIVFTIVLAILLPIFRLDQLVQ
ncbi:type II secretion system inner membrane protein GspF [Metallibacterium scheffleri]|uniref:type II secretion system inner membrane protein GspF n=1 Tax=Metallibacterium scheffleri TaxID=993689 RepID=UPI0023F0D63A|nr:type II secretion system inner membrane protein GspF [Metallibacterium scheffleri]